MHAGPDKRLLTSQNIRIVYGARKRRFVSFRRLFPRIPADVALPLLEPTRIDEIPATDVAVRGFPAEFFRFTTCRLRAFRHDSRRFESFRLDRQ